MSQGVQIKGKTAQDKSVHVLVDDAGRLYLAPDGGGTGGGTVIIPNGLIPMGEYSAATDYSIGSFVSYNGSSYVMYVDAAAGTNPSDTSKWAIVADKGDGGATGQGVPTGGTVNQVLTKASGADFDTAWATPSGGGGGAVNSVNTMTGDVVLDADDIDDTSTTNRFVTAADVTKLSNLSGTNSGDQDLSSYATNAAVTSALAGKLDKTGGTLTGDLILDGSGGDAKEINMPSSRPTDDISGGTDGTSRINLYSYQRANYNSYGENIRHFLMKKDAKSMDTWYFPSGGYDGSRDPVGTMKPVVWTGAHWESNNHSGNHKHWAVETPDSTGAIQTRLEVRFGDVAADGSISGLDKTLIATNLANFAIRCSNGQKFILSASDADGSDRVLEFNKSAEGADADRLWKLKVDGGATADIGFSRYDNSGVLVDQPFSVNRSNGVVTIGGTSGTSNGLVVNRNGGIALTINQLAAAATVLNAVGADTSSQAFGTRVSGDASGRFAAYTTGLMEWGSGAAARDTNLYRVSADTLKTDDKFVIGTPGTTAGSAVTIDGTQTLTNKTVSGASNTFSAIPNSAITGLGSLATASSVTASQISDATTAGRNMLTATDVAAQTAILNNFTSALKGLVPASGGGTTNFLRADGTWAAPGGGGGGSPGGNANELQYNDGAGGFAGAANVEVDTGNLKLVSTTDPSPPTGGIIQYSKLIAGRHMPKIIGPSGIDTVMETGWSGNSKFILVPQNATTAPLCIGGAITTAVTISHQQTIASANPWLATRRTRFACSTTAGNNSGARTAYAQWFSGSAARFGGFFFRTQFGTGTNLNGGQCFIGLCASTAALAATAGAVSNLINSVGCGYDTTDSSAGNWQFYHNDGSGTATKVDLGANAVRNTTHGFDLIIACAPNSNEFFVRIVNLHSNVVVLDTSYTTDVPAVNTGLAFKAEVNNGAVAAANSLEFAKVYIETDY